MLVEAVAKARKPSGYITLGAALEIVAKANSGFKWEHNQYKDMHFRFDSIANAFDTEKGTYTFLHFKYIAEENQIKSKRLNVNSETEFAKAKEAIGMLRAAYRKLFAELAKKRHSIKIKIIGSKDKTNNSYGYSDVGSAVWTKCRPTIYKTGCIPYSNSNDAPHRGVLFLNKKDVLELAKKLERAQKVEAYSKHPEVDEESAKILKGYIIRLSQRAKEKKLTAQRKANAFNSQTEEVTRVLINVEQCRQYVINLAMAHKWGVSPTSFTQFFHDTTTINSSFINSCGIALGGRPPKIAGVPSPHSVIEELKAEILKEIADKKY